MPHAGETPLLRPVPWFLATAPSPGSEMVERTAVTTLLDRCVDTHHVAMLSAPSGFGKTVAVSQWAARRARATPGSVAWVTLTERLTDVADVLRATLTALEGAARQRDDEAMLRALSAVYRSPTYDAAIAATAALASGVPVTLIIDDFHHARDTLAGAGLNSYVEHCPQWLRLVLLTTDTVGPELTRLRIHGRMAVITAKELAMTAEEVGTAAALLGRPVDAREAQTMLATTGGWPAAVRMQLLSGQDSPAFDADTDLTEYIRSAVLARLRPDLAEFVLSTTVTPRVDGALLAALWGRPDHAALISECASSGLFIERFGSPAGAVYQWHSMFATHCQSILRAQDPRRWRMLNEVVAQELQGRYPLQAVSHAILAEDAPLTTQILTDRWLELLLQSNAEALDRACIAAMSALGEHPELLMIRACCRDIAGDTTGARHLLARAKVLDPGQTMSPRMDFIAALTEVLVSNDHEAMTKAASCAEAWLDDRTVVGASVYPCALFLLGWANSRLRRAERGSAQLESAVHECTAAGMAELAERARQALTFAAAQSGDFDRALAVLRRGGITADTAPALWLTHDGDGIERFAEGWVHFWRAEVDAARDAFLEVGAGAGSGYPDIARAMLAFAAAAVGDRDSLDRAESALGRIADTDTHGVPWTSYRLTARARLAEARGEPSRALELAAQLVGRSHVPMMSALASGISCRLGDTDLARALARAATDPQAQPYSRVYGHLTVALLDTDHDELERALALGAEQRILLPFAEYPDTACLNLLIAHRNRTAHGRFLDDALVVTSRAGQRRERQGPAPLTPREVEVLTYLRTPMTAEEIAVRLSVSVNTLKTHQRAIYRKLGVANRREAVHAAGRLPILQPQNE
ncbi:MAG: AAA family ATPase [Actinobacteria bacterium]|nr:AAA family ATPase [Actinomycetota bacterium]